MKLITIPLTDLIDSLLAYDTSLESGGGKDRTYITKTLGEAIKIADPNEELTHVIIGTAECTLWRKKDWVLCEEKYLESKRLADERVEEHNRRNTLIEKIRKSLMKEMGLKEDDMEIATTITQKLLRDRRIDAIKQLCGMDIDIKEEEL